MMYNGDIGERDNHIGSQETQNNTLPDYSVCVGKYVDNWNENTTLLCNDIKETVVPDWISNIDGWIIVSQRFVNAVKHLENGGIQYLPIKIDAVQPQMKGQKYYVANIVNVLDAIDYDKCYWIYIAKKYRDPINCVIKREVVDGNHIFNLKHDILSLTTIVSEDFKKAIEQSNLLGFGFDEVEVV